MKIQTFSVAGTISGTTMSGTESEAYNVFVAGTTTIVGTWFTTSTFTLTRQ